LEPQTPVSVRMASLVCALAKDRISAVVGPVSFQRYIRGF
jgi:hypothetical protein